MRKWQLMGYGERELDICGFLLSFVDVGVGWMGERKGKGGREKDEKGKEN